jgi:transposase
MTQDIIGVDIATRVFQAHGAAADGSVVFRKKLSRSHFLSFLAAQPRCTVAMEACATAHDCTRSHARTAQKNPCTNGGIHT